MHTFLPVLAACTFAAAAAGAAGIDTRQAPRAAGGPAGGTLAPAGGHVIYSTFNSDRERLYDCCVAYSLGAPEGDLGFQQQVAMAFTPPADAVLRKVYVAISLDGGTNRMTGLLAEDAGGLPGRVIRQVVIENLAPPGTCCATQGVPGKGTPLTGGKTYWIVAHPTGDTNAGWNYANTGVIGPVAYDMGEGWQNFMGAQAAFAVIGE